MFPHTSHVESIGVFDLVEDFQPKEFVAPEVRQERSGQEA
jgi:23S rRNA (uracil1939-C5)-methyltransferase